MVEGFTTAGGRGGQDAARATWQAALAILTDLDHADAEQVCRKLG